MGTRRGVSPLQFPSSQLCPQPPSRSALFPLGICAHCSHMAKSIHVTIPYIRELIRTCKIYAASVTRQVSPKNEAQRAKLAEHESERRGVLSVGLRPTPQ